MNNSNKTIKNTEEGPKREGETLSIFCVDTINVKARMTFDSCTVKGVSVTYWMDDDEDLEERVDAIFSVLFDEVIKSRGSNKKAVVKL